MQHNPLWDNDWLIGCVTLSSLIPPYPPRLWWLCCVLMLICCHWAARLTPPWLPGSGENRKPGPVTTERVILPGSPHLIRCSSYWSPAPAGSHQSIPGIFQLICKFWLASVLAWLLSLLPWHQTNDFSPPLSPHLLWPAIVIWPRTGSGLQFT